MSAAVRALNAAGIARLRAFLGRLRAGAVEPPPWDLLDDEAHTVELPAELVVAQRRFDTRWGLGEYLNQVLQPLRPADVDGNAGMWSWLSLFYFDQVCPPRRDGTRRPGRDYRHIPDFDFRHRYRHLLYGPYAVHRRHGGHAILLLSGPLHSENTIYHEIAARIDLLANRGVVDAARLLYMDPRTGLPKRGAQGARGKPGTIARFVRVLQQLDVTYDIYGLSGEEILDLLPAEFDPWRRQLVLLAGSK